MTPTAPTSTSPLAPHIWQRARGLLLAAALLAVAGVTLAALRSTEHTAPLDPGSASPDGSKALARLLTDRGVHTTVLTDSSALHRQTGPDTTLLVPFPNSLTERQRTAVRKAAEDSGRTVLLAPDTRTTSALTPGIRTFAALPTAPTPPDCDLAAARRAGGADLGGHRYSTTGPAEKCYPRSGRATLLRLHAPSRGDTVLLGTADPLRNEHLDQHGNASLALQLLGPHPQLLWYLPSDSERVPSDDGERSFFDLLPGGWSWAAVQLALAALLAALWRARRLGPLVTERLPVAVPAAETTEGRSRLYRKANDRGHAADALRTACRGRLALLAGVPRAQAHDREILAPALAARVVHRASSEPGEPAYDEARIRSLLFGSSPANDTALLHLADELDRLEELFAPAGSQQHRRRADKDITP
ncbi:DUF4350 domain-containing protein [Streptomyces sp. WMMB303]|uniref:DUF4350 domain-containing protein n=1 Tax=Streptomyces sp. WMMB303 TaxID=3034154 RepID=UPI0023EBF7A2|nr:DUF4350 domain-containing protein [Streptomyces sp. WMMB303]MDF4251003.1 DUF4350 domain-containing protein [Streptomyces sp. WMMB303]